MARLAYKRAFNQNGAVRFIYPPEATSVIFTMPSEGGVISQANFYTHHWTSTENITVSIRAVDGDNLPILPDLASDTLVIADGIQEGGNESRPILTQKAQLSCTLSGSTNYALVVIPLDGAALVYPEFFREQDWDEQYEKNKGTLRAVATKKSLDAGVTWEVAFGIPNFEIIGTLCSPIVTTRACTGTTGESSTGNGLIANMGCSSVTQHGHCWSTSPSPTTADSKTQNGTAPNLGQFTSNITGLIAGTLYYVRAYAKNSYGTGYGDDVTITTSSTISGRDIGVRGTNLVWFDEDDIERKARGTLVTGDSDILKYLYM